jgi:predicted RNA methylase
MCIRDSYYISKEGTKMHTAEQLKKICEVLLEEKTDYAQLSKAIDDLNKLFYEASKLEDNTGIVRNDIFLPTGKAIGTLWAAMCVKEMMRTKQFIRGIYEGIKAARQKFHGKPIHILYAGTGPFATLVIPLTTLYSSMEINFTFLEINPESIKLLNNVVEALHVEEYVNEIILCDAAEYKHYNKKPIHMIITETMLNALQKEPQVAITLNLVPQMLKGGILIPQNIKIEAALLNPQKNIDRMLGAKDYNGKCYHILDTIFELNKDTENNSGLFPEVEISIPQNIEDGYKELCLFTTIQIFDDVYLSSWQCSLNMPKLIMQLDQENNLINKVGFKYLIKENPGFSYRVIS